VAPLVEVFLDGAVLNYRPISGVALPEDLDRELSGVLSEDLPGELPNGLDDPDEVLVG
jgi:hypothetical protein